MARMIPSTFTGGSSGERKLYGLLEHDPATESWTVIHSLRLSGHPRGVGEADFIVLVPERGILVIEVKAARNPHVKNGQWFDLQPTGGPDRRSPFEQADQVQHALRAFLVRERFDLRNVPLLSCVWFTHWAAKEHLQPAVPAWEEWQLLDVTDLETAPQPPTRPMRIDEVAALYGCDRAELCSRLRALGAPPSISGSDPIRPETVELLCMKGILPRLQSVQTCASRAVLRVLDEGRRWLMEKEGIHKDFSSGVGPSIDDTRQIVEALSPDSVECMDPNDWSTGLYAHRVALYDDNEFGYFAQVALKLGLELRYVCSTELESKFIEVYSASGPAYIHTEMTEFFGVESVLLESAKVECIDEARGLAKISTSCDDDVLEISVQRYKLLAGRVVFHVSVTRDPYAFVDRMNQEIDDSGLDGEPMDREENAFQTRVETADIHLAIVDLLLSPHSQWPAAQKFLPENALLQAGCEVDNR